MCPNSNLEFEKESWGPFMDRNRNIFCKDHQVVPLPDQLAQGQHHLVDSVDKRGEGMAFQELLKGISNSSNASQMN